MLVLVVSYSYYDTVENPQSPSYYCLVADGEGVEAAREKRGLLSVGVHISLSSSTTRFSMMKFWRSIVFFPM